MKRLMVLILVVIFALSVAVVAAPGKAPAKKKVVKKPVVSDQLLIKKAVLAYDDALVKSKKPTSLSSVKFVPIKIANGWAVTTYDQLDSRGRVIPGDGPQYILKKNRGKWRVITITTEYNLRPEFASKIGLPKAVAKKLGITLESYG